MFALSVSSIDQSSRPIKVELQLSGKAVTMELDTGAAVSVMPEATFRQSFPDVNLRPSSLILETYTGQVMKVVGETSVDVQYKDQLARNLDLVVVQSEGPPLLGRSWLKHLRLDWKSIGTVVCGESLTSILNRHSKAFAEGLEHIQPFKAHLSVAPDAQPKFCKARPVTCALRSAVVEELDRLEMQGVLEKVPRSEWAMPVVVVPKKDSQIRLCRDYKVTVNPVLSVDQYPLPKPEDLFATLAGGKTFSKLDLSHAYNQLELDEESRKFVTINTHRGLYRYWRLPFGVASAPALFQRVMDTILQGMDNVMCFIDDILITGATEEEHLRNLEEVLSRLEKHGVRIKRSKCSFMQPSVEYLGHRVDKRGLHTTEEKLRAISEAPTPKNVQELRSFLGLQNYYARFY